MGTGFQVTAPTVKTHMTQSGRNTDLAAVQGRAQLSWAAGSGVLGGGEVALQTRGVGRL